MIILQVEGGGVPWVNLVVIVLIVLFLTVPFVILLAEYARNRGPDGRTTSPAPASGPTSRVAAKSKKPQPADRAIHIVVSHEISHAFRRERVPREIGYIPSDLLVEGPLEFRGYLEVGARTIVRGDMKVYGSVALDSGAQVEGSLTTTGNLYVGVGGVVAGRAKVGNRAFLARWSRIDELEALGDVELEEGSEVRNGLSAPKVQQVESVLEDPSGIMERPSTGVR